MLANLGRNVLIRLYGGAAHLTRLCLRSDITFYRPLLSCFAGLLTLLYRVELGYV